METIALIKNKQKKLNKKVGKLKDKITAGDVLIKENPLKPKQKKKKINQGRGAVYIGHIPHGFYEEEMRDYFSQFGVVTRVRIARSKRTGNCKGYGFVEFKNAEVAKIVADTMNNYLMFSRLLKCRYIPPEEQHEKLFVRTITPNSYPRKKHQAQSTKNKNRLVDQDKENDLRQKALKKIEDFKKFFEERGIEFNFKVNDPSCDTVNNANKISNGGRASNENGNGSDTDSSIDSDYEDETDDQFGVLEIDESDDEIQFKTPPQVKKVIKRSSTSALIPFKSKKLKTTFQSLTELTGKNLQNERQFSKPVKKNALSTLTSQSKFPKIQGNLKKWAKSLNNHSQGDTVSVINKNTNEIKGVGQKFEKQKKEKTSLKSNLSKTFKAKKKQNVNLNAVKKGGEALLLESGKKKGKSELSPKKVKNVNGLEKPKKIKKNSELKTKKSDILKKKKKKSDDKIELLKKKKNKSEKKSTKLSKVVGKKFAIKKTKISKKVNSKS